MNTSNKGKIITEAKRIEVDSLYSSKSHFCAAQFWSNFHLWLGVPSAVFSAIAGGSALSQFDHHNTIAGILAIIVSILTAITTFINPNKKADQHQKAGNSYNSLRNQSRLFYTLKTNNTATQALANQLEKLNSKRDKLNSDSPQIPKWAFEKARHGIEEGEATYKVDSK